jgi:hypothetical protein
MRRWLAGGWIPAITSIAIFAGTARAQRVAGPGDDAIMVPRGAIRFSATSDWSSFDQRFGAGTPATGASGLQPLGSDFTVDSIGVRQLPGLTGLQSELRGLAGDPKWNPTLGNSLLSLRDRVSTFTFRVEAGLVRRLSIGVDVPYVVTRANPFFNVNTSGTEGNIGFNPALTNTAAAAQNATLLSQFTASAASLAQKLSDCAANPGAAGCPELNAQRTSAQSLIDNSTAFATGVNTVYGASPFVPIRGTDAQLAIEARVAAFKALYAQFAGFGVPQITSSGPFASQNRITVTDAQQILSDPAFGISADPLTTTSRSHFGDIAIGGKLSLFDSFGGSTEERMSPHGLNFRTAIGGAFELPTGQVESPNNFIDVGTGGTKAIEGRWFADLLIGSHFWESFVVRVNKPFADDQEMRIVDVPGTAFAPLYSRQTVHRALGRTIQFETSPRLVINDFFSVGGQYVYRHKAQDQYTGTFTIPAAVTGFSDVTLDATALGMDTETKEQRASGGLTYSNLYAFEQGRAKLPFEVTYLHSQTISGSGRTQPKSFSDAIQLRVYFPVFGRR